MRGRPQPDWASAAQQVFHIEVATDARVVEQCSFQGDFAGARLAALKLAERIVEEGRRRGGLRLDWRVVLQDADFAVLESIPFWQVINGR